MKHQIVAVFHLREKEAVLAAMALALGFGKERSEVRQPLLTAGQQIFRGQRVGQFLKALGVAAFQEGIGALLEVDLFLSHPDGEPVMLIQTYAGGEGKVWAHAHEHASPTGVVQIEVVVIDPALVHLQMPAIILFIAVGDQNPSRLPGSYDRYHLIGFHVPEVGIDEIIPTPVGHFQYRHVPFQRPVRNPVLILLGDLSEFVAGHSLAVAIGIEEPDDSFRLLEGLNQAVQQQPVKAPVVQPNATLVMFEKGVHGVLLCGQIPGA
jgi:hypothetical protein